MKCHTIVTRHYNATVWKDLERLSGFDLQHLNLQTPTFDWSSLKL